MLTPTERSKPSAFAAEKAELGTVLASTTFVRAPLLSRMLAFVCEQHFLGQESTLKEYSIGTQALGRGPDFDPDDDSIVRVMASRLRKRLTKFYATEGADHAIKIFLSESGYIPIFVTERTSERAPLRLVRRNGSFWLALGCVAMLAFGSAAYFTRRGKPAVEPARTPVTPAIAAAAPIRIGAGTERDRIDSSGVKWGSDRYYQGGEARNFAERHIRRTLDPLLYLSAREGDFRYDIPLAPGVYELHLYFAETVHGVKQVGDYGEGTRIFDVAMNGKPLLTEFDIICDGVGSNVADERVFKDVRPDRDGLLHLQFAPNPGKALLNAIEILPGSPGKLLPVRVTASGTPVYDNTGRSWQHDQYFSGGNSSKWIRNVKGQEDPALFYSQRWGNFDYAIPVADGVYTATLYFSEAYYGAPSQTGGINGGGAGSRVFDVFCNGEALLRSLDVVREAGGANIQLTKTFRHLKPNAQGKLDIWFIPDVNKAIVSAIEIVPEP